MWWPKWAIPNWILLLLSNWKYCTQPFTGNIPSVADALVAEFQLAIQGRIQDFRGEGAEE